MVSSPLLAVGFLMSLVMVVFVVCCVLLILLVLVQKGKGGGLSGALAGGAMGNVLGAKSKEPLTYFTIMLVCVFLFLSVIMAKFYKPSVNTDQPVGAVQSAPASQDSGTLPAAPSSEDTGSVPSSPATP